MTFRARYLAVTNGIPFVRDRRDDALRVWMYEIGGNDRLRDPNDLKVIRRLSTNSLHWWIGKAVEPVSVSMLTAELRRRETRGAYRVSLAALAVSIAALVLSLLKR